MVKYHIKSIEELTGIKSHTLRIWEKRYNLVIPHRTDTNIRYYDDNQLQEILTISLLYQNGLKISKIAKLSKLDRKIKVANLENKIPEKHLSIHKLIENCISFDQFQFKTVLKKSIKSIGLEKTMIEVIQPFLYKVGTLWMVNKISPGQEHFASNIIRSELILKINDAESKNKITKSTIVLFLPENETHEIGILFAYYLLSSMGHRVVYLGANVPTESAIDCYNNVRASFLLTVSTIAFKKTDAETYFKNLKDKGVNLIIAGGQVTPRVKNIKDIIVLDSLEDAIEKLKYLN